MNNKPTTCDGCGACCMAQGSPPNYFGLVAALEGVSGYTFILDSDTDMDREDFRRIKALPPEAFEELREAVHGKLEYDSDGPCIWLDMETRRCRFYEHRPVTCSDDTVTIGNAACLRWRKDFGIGGSE